MLLSLPQIAFFRAVILGIEPKDAFERYLLLAHDSERCDERVARRTLHTVRETCAGLASKAGRPSAARLLRLHILSAGAAEPAGQQPPSLEDFSAEAGLDGFSEREVRTLWMERYGQGEAARKQRQRARLVERQLRALDEIARLHARGPERGDLIELWFAPHIAQKLKAAGLHTLHMLAERVQRPGWHRSIDGVGPAKAARIVSFLATYHLVPMPEKKEGFALPPTPSGQAAVAPALPAVMSGGPMSEAAHALWVALDGQARSDSVLGADDDASAVRAFIENYRGNTLRLYRREIERLLIWCALVLQKPVSRLSRSDLMEYAAFIRDPQPRSTWCAPRNIPRSSPAWRPFEGPLSESSARVAMAVVGKLFAFLSGTGYIAANPAVQMPKARKASLRQQFGRRTLSDEAFAALRAQARGDSPKALRLALAIDLMFACGLRISEACAATLADVQSLGDDGLVLNVVGKGGKFREVPVPEELVYRARALALARGCKAADLERAHLIGPCGASFGAQIGDPYAGIDTGVLARDIRDAARDASTQALASGNEALARRVAKVSAHWLRHTHASKALASGADIAAVQANLGHASLATTSIYASAEQRARLAQMRKFWSATAQ